METVDVAIIGSGAAGSLLAAKLSKAGKSVVVLEGGPERRVDDLYSSQIWARRIKWFGPPTETSGPEPISVNFGSGWGTGGAALHHYAVWLRRHADEFDMKSRFGVGLDWPFTYDDLRPYYDQIQAEVGISGDAEAEVWRPPGAPYPMPPLPRFRQATLIAEGFNKLGLRTSPLPMAINSVEYKGRPACKNDGWCDAGCPILALANPLAVYLPEAKKAGAEIRHNSYATRVLKNSRTEHVSGVEYYDAEHRRRVQRANLVIVAAYTFQTPRILLNSATENQPNGLANSSGQVGKYLMTHSSCNIFGFFHEETENFRGTTGGQLLSQEAYAKTPTRGYVNSSQWLIANAPKPNDLLGIANSRPDLFGNDLHHFMRTAAKHVATMTFTGEDLPKPQNEKKSLFIESVLNRLTVPAFYLAPDEGDPDRFEVVDGQQRLTTLADFYSNHFSLLPDDECQYFGSSVQYAGTRYGDLHEQWQRSFRRYILNIVMLPQGMKLDLRLEIFRRINEGGTPLSGQDIRLGYYSESNAVRFIQLAGIYDTDRTGSKRMIKSCQGEFDWPWNLSPKEAEMWRNWWSNTRTAIGQTSSEMFLWYVVAKSRPAIDRLLDNTKHLTSNLALSFRNSTDEVLDIVCAELRFEDRSCDAPRLLPDAQSLAVEYFNEFRQWWAAMRSKCSAQVQVARHRSVALLIPGLVETLDSPDRVSDSQWGWIGKFVSRSRETANELNVKFPESKGRWTGNKGQRAQIDAYFEVAREIARK